MPPRRVDVQVSGEEKVVQLLGLLGKAARYVGRMRWAIQNPAPYTHWINYGYYRSGRPGRRRAGPARMMEAGEERILQLLPGVLPQALEKGEAGARRAIAGVMGEGTKVTKSKTPVVSGRLRGGFHTVDTAR